MGHIHIEILVQVVNLVQILALYLHTRRTQLARRACAEKNTTPHQALCTIGLQTGASFITWST
jgi:hypothetical protein